MINILVVENAKILNKVLANSLSNAKINCVEAYN
jgi:hypothetical protein